MAESSFTAAATSPYSPRASEYRCLWEPLAYRLAPSAVQKDGAAGGSEELVSDVRYPLGP